MDFAISPKYLLEDSRPPQGSKTFSRLQDLLKASRPPQSFKISSGFDICIQRKSDLVFATRPAVTPKRLGDPGVDNYKIYETIGPLQQDVDNTVDAARTATAEASIPEDDEAREVDLVECTLDMIRNAFVSDSIIFWCEIICEKDNELNECQLPDQLVATLEWLHCGAIRNSPGIQLKSGGDQLPPTCVYLITST
ncbi:hypothetical protein C8F04DRAFT_1193778 [Mycena alexandri]|uniref:Uncharacterized protein n=1 Tax=Mycena alexandri TaxID=1745969 RepID=A0AAD6WS93_9AGAR|nr:hypothetical protein C8F04DRAFT_1193778 [Mycena alexandri]